MSDFTAAVNALLTNETGQFIPDDNGMGASKWGITEVTAKGFGLGWTAEDIQSLTREAALSFYERFYWQGAHVGLLADQGVANKALDLLVNVGPIAIKWLQAAADVCEDTIIGQQTAAAVNAMDPNCVLAGMRARGEHYYRALAAKDPAKFGPDLDGWLARLAR
jgi:lysozyme family protein